MDDHLVQTFNFRVRLFRATGTTGPSLLGDGGFQEVSGLQVEMEVKDHEEGGRNDGVVRRVGRAKYQPLVLKRGMFGPEGGDANADLWQWLQDVVSGIRPVRRYDGAVTVLDGTGSPRATWNFTRGLPSRLVGPSLDARTGEIAMEELHIAHEGLVLEGTA